MYIFSADSEDEMCNFYVMYYTVNDGKKLYSESCWQRASSSLVYPELPSLTTPTTTPTTEPVVTTDASEGNGEEDNYECSKPIPPGSGNSRCINSTTSIPIPSTTTPEPNPSTPSRPFFEGGSNDLESKPLGLVQAEDWTLNGVDIPGITLGQVSAVAVDKEGSVHVLHRGNVVWDYT